MRGALIVLAVAGAVGAVVAAPAREPALRVVDAYARAMPPGARTAGAYLAIENRGSEEDELVGASSARAASVELHSMRDDAGVMRMRAVAAIPVPPGETVRLAPSGLHLMLIDPKPPLKEGEHIPLTLRFKRAGNVGADLVVQSTSAGAQHGH